MPIILPPKNDIGMPSKNTSRTGLSKQHYVEETPGGRRVGIRHVDHPIFSATSATRAALKGLYLPGNPHRILGELHEGYHVDSYIRNSVDKYAEKVVSAGFRIETPYPEIESYLTRRFATISVSIQYPFELLISDITRRYVRDGNVFIIKAWSKQGNPHPGFKLRGLNGRPIIAGYYVLEGEYLTPLIEKESGRQVAWIYKERTVDHKVNERIFPLDQIYHFTYCKEGIEGWGHSQVAPALDDIKALRDAEEAVLKLIYRYLNPLIHVSVPDLIGDGAGRQEDIDMGAQIIGQMAHDGFVVTGPNYKMEAIGAESQALRAENYLSFFKDRSFAGLGVSDLIMGEAQYTGAGGANAVSVQMHDRVRHYQYSLAKFLTLTLISDLLQEAGYEPLTSDGRNEGFTAQWKFNEFDSEEERKTQAHMADQFNKGVVTLSEARKSHRKDTLSINEQDAELYQGITGRIEHKFKKDLELIKLRAKSKNGQSK